MARERILRAALERFGSQGYEGTTLSQIATDAGIRKPSIYAHFSSKRDIFITLLSESFNSEKLLIDSLPNRYPYPMEQLRVCLFGMIERFADCAYPKFWLRSIYLPPRELENDVGAFDMAYSTLIDNIITNTLRHCEKKYEALLPGDMLVECLTGMLRGVHGELLYKGCVKARCKAEAMWSVFQLSFRERG